MVNLYECTVCNYKTKDRGNICRHNKTKKHLTNVGRILEPFSTKLLVQQKVSSGLPVDSQQTTKNSEKTGKIEEKSVYTCEYCNKCITRYNNVNKHLNSCAKKKKKESNLIEQIKKLNSELSLFKTKANHYEDENDHYKEEAKYYKQMLMEAGGLVKKSVSALTYSITNYDSALHIKTIEVNNIKTFNNPHKDIVEDILSAYKHKTLSKYLGELILKLYKKTNPLDQSIWNTDDNRLTYIIKELLNDNSSNWIVDKKGVKTVQYLISPLLSFIKKLIISYQKSVIPDPDLSLVEMEIFLENSKAIIEIINDIDDNITAKDVLKYISAYLRFNDK